ncbi:uncharacterized protein LOC123542900 [Mercenaria mercenaria]|uniref:uncharacterized protein LOC123542900 n=1 Tax=Mercenaria mercenaria TaxID=6596 RepID=UPI00234E98F6|nr:uncharacterized protein LOC123542900 [Mercenaria mercenaria]
MAALSDPKNQFMKKLMDFGKEKVKEMIPRGDTCNQYVVACIASEEELEERYSTIIEDAGKGSPETTDTYYFSKRLVVILNKHHWHGEARLLDPTGRLWETVTTEKDKKDDREPFEGRYFVGKMRENFPAEVWGTPKLVLFSHYIPCTIPRHQCARLIEEYVNTTGTEIILSYERSHGDTDEERAYAILSRNKEYITIILPWKQDQEAIVEQAESFLERMERGTKRDRKKHKKRKERETENTTESSQHRQRNRKRKRKRSK